MVISGRYCNYIYPRAGHRQVQKIVSILLHFSKLIHSSRITLLLYHSCVITNSDWLTVSVYLALSDSPVTPPVCPIYPSMTSDHPMIAQPTFPHPASTHTTSSHLTSRYLPTWHWSNWYLPSWNLNGPRSSSVHQTLLNQWYPCTLFAM